MVNTIAIIEDNETMRLGMKESLLREGFDVHAFSEAGSAFGFIKTHDVGLIITDLRMQPVDGIEVLEFVRKNELNAQVIMISAYGTVETAVKAMQLGAADFLTKPFSNEELRVRVHNIFNRLKQQFELERLLEQNVYLNEELTRKYPEIIGKSRKMLEVFKLIEKVAAEESTILIEGESGTGKELVAHAIHRLSKRSEKPFIRVNCGALNDNLLESELFGHEKGAFTGAVSQRKGRFELADGGTLFLDEIGDISSAMQVKLLRVLQEKEFERVGAEQTIKTDVRIIVATNKKLQSLVREKTFREDLYYRLSVIPLQLPTLRDRKEDIPLLVKHFLDKNNRKGTIPSIEKSALNLLCDYSWPGNIRELENMIERLTVISSEHEITLETVNGVLGKGSILQGDFSNLPLDDALASLEKKLIEHALKKAGGIKNRAAKYLGVKTSTLYYKLEKYGLI